MQYLNNSQDKANCPEIGEVFNNIDVNFNDLTSGSSSLDFSGGRRRRQTGGSQQQTLTVGYIQQCVINQAFDLVRQYDVYRYYHSGLFKCLKINLYVYTGRSHLYMYMYISH